MLALIFFLASTAPSLVPRSWLFQEIVSGVSLSIGYELGSALSAGVRKVIRSEPHLETKRIAWRILAVSTVVIGALALFWGAKWQQDVRSHMEWSSSRSSSGR